MRLLHGDAALKMDVAKFPINEEAAAKQLALWKAMQEVFDGAREFPVRVGPGDGKGDPR